MIEYDEELSTSYSKEECFIYVSKSKNGMQYLDPLNGQTQKGDSEKYVKTMIYM